MSATRYPPIASPLERERAKTSSWPTIAVALLATFVCGFAPEPEAASGESAEALAGVTVWQSELRDAILLPVLVLQSLFIVALLIQGRRRRRTEKLLRESRDIMNFAAVAANLRFWSWDIDRNRVWITDHKQRSIAKPADWTLDPLDCVSLIHPDDRPRWDACVKEAVAKADSFDIEHRTLSRAGRVRWAKVRARAETDSSGRVVRLNGIVLDITERKASEADAAKQREILTHSGRIGILGELSGALAHELSQPLAAILSNAQAAQHVLSKPSPDLAELRNIVTDIVSDDNRARDVIAHLHALLKKGDGEFKPVDLNNEVKLALGLAHSDLVRRQVEVSTMLEPSIGKVWGDRVQISQVLLNLILNAADAMQVNNGGNRRLTIMTSVNGEGAPQVSVRDSGPGIRAEAMSHIFDPFYSTKSQGLGLGLSICRSIVTAHKGRLWVKNNVDNGATFFVSFPSLVEEAAA